MLWPDIETDGFVRTDELICAIRLPFVAVPETMLTRSGVSARLASMESDEESQAGQQDNDADQELHVRENSAKLVEERHRQRQRNWCAGAKIKMRC
jgi:hypothetical protein